MKNKYWILKMEKGILEMEEIDLNFIRLIDSAEKLKTYKKLSILSKLC